MQISMALLVYLPISCNSLIGRVLYQVSRSRQMKPLSPAVLRIMEYSGMFPIPLARCFAAVWNKEWIDKSVMQHGIETYDPKTHSVN